MIQRLLPLVGLAVLSGCFATRVTVPRTAPAEIDLGSYRRLAVGGVGGQGGDAVNAEVTRALFASQRFEVLDRQHIAELTREQDFQISGRVSDESAVSVGQMLGAAVLVVGDMVTYDYDESVSTSKSKCTKGKDTKATCVDYTRSASAHVAASFKVIDAETGKILAVRTLQAQDGRSTTERDAKPEPYNAKAEMLATCTSRVADAFAAVIAPHVVQDTVELLDDGDLPELERGNNMAKIGAWPKAIAEYQAAVARLPGELSTGDQAKAYYNLGVALGYSGDYDSGIEQLERSYALDAEDRTAQQIAKVKQFKTDSAELARQTASSETQASR